MLFSLSSQTGGSIKENVFYFRSGENNEVLFYSIASVFPTTATIIFFLACLFNIRTEAFNKFRLVNVLFESYFLQLSQFFQVLPGSLHLTSVNVYTSPLAIDQNCIENLSQEILFYQMTRKSKVWLKRSSNKKFKI